MRVHTRSTKHLPALHEIPQDDAEKAKASTALARKARRKKRMAVSTKSGKDESHPSAEPQQPGSADPEATNERTISRCDWDCFPGGADSDVIGELRLDEAAGRSEDHGSISAVAPDFALPAWQLCGITEVNALAAPRGHLQPHCGVALRPWCSDHDDHGGTCAACD